MFFVVYRCCSTSFQSVFFHFQKFILEENSGNGTGINLIRIDLSKTQPFSVKIGMQRMDNEGGQTFIKKESRQILAVVSGGFQS